jgi:hypothetical protein
MTDQLNPHEAARALAQIRADQERVIDQAAVPLGFYWAIAALNVMFGVATDLGRPVLFGIGLGLFLLGIGVAVAWAVRHSHRVKPRRGLFGPTGAAIIVGYVILTAGGNLATLFLLQTSGVEYPATLANLVGAVLIVSIAPLVNGGLRRVMLANRSTEQ